MAAPQAIIDLVERYEQNRESYRASTYSESEIRTEFIDPFFEALGWDIANKAGDAEQYKDVVREASVEVEGKAKKPDYEFRIGGTRKFYVEAKKPAVNLEDDAGVAFQIRRYSWSAKLPLGILTNFGEFAIYDCRNKPKVTDKAGVGRLYYFTHKDYLDKWDEIAGIFSRNAIRKGAFDRYAISDKKRGTQTVDEAFLADIEDWREELAKNIAIRNKQLTVEELNYAVQQTIDRIIFLRICEDRGIESYGELQKIVAGKDIYKELLKHFLYADERYDSGLFHFKKEKDVKEDPDDLTPSLKIDDAPLKDIIKHLYYPNCPYEFSVISADILGQVYERFLGKVIRLTPSHQAKVEYKLEVKKAGGVYYTPTYIVDYIVKNTVGKLVEDKTPSQVDKLKILDPACGSGSFLIGAYQYLLDWYLDYYTKHDPAKFVKGKAPKLYQSSSGWRLTLPERRRILLNNIHGVDIDGQAVEVTKLSLWLKVLEGETQRGFHRILPDLSNNIKCGNSLIGMDYFADKLLPDREELDQINPMDWVQAFPEIIKSGGFDTIIGNPPYVRPHNLEPGVKTYFWSHYPSFIKKADIYCCFIERSLDLLKRGGLFGFIVSNGFLRLDSFENLRKTLLSKTSLHNIIDFTGNVFTAATVSTCILLFSKGKVSKPLVKVAITEPNVNPDILAVRAIPQSIFEETYKNIFDLSVNETEEKIKHKMRLGGISIGNQYQLSFGLKTGDDAKFLSCEQGTSEHKPMLRGEDIHRYAFAFKGEYVLYDTSQMRAHRQTARPGTPERFEQPKVLIRDTGGKLEGTFEDDNFYVKDVIIVSDAKKDTNRLKLLTGIINSKLLRFYYETSFPTLHVQRDELASLPLPSSHSMITSSDKSKSIITLVEDMLALTGKLSTVRTPHSRESLQRQVDATDRQIDQLVYELYGLTEGEVDIVENNDE